MIIYRIKNLINGKVYIGQTIHSLEHRKKQHLQCASRGDDTKLYEAIRQYGAENFKFEKIASVKTVEDLNHMETYFIKKFDSVENGYNMNYGGYNNTMFSKEVKEKHDSIMRSDEVRKRISDSLKKYRSEHPFSKEHRERLSAKAMGNHNFGRCDTRCVKCHCVDHNDNDAVHRFNSYKDGGLWWFGKYRPFGEHYAQSTYQKRIVESIDTGKCHHRRKVFSDVQWFRDE